MTDTKPRAAKRAKAAANKAPGKLYMIGNAHIDPVWLWNWQEGYAEVKATFRSALDRLREDPDFKFTCSSAAHYAWVERADPKMFDEIRERVAEGRWEVVGGWWVQPDCNLPSGESFVRQGLYGQRFFKSRLGVTARTGYNPDSFGHAASLPQILLKSGLENYTFMRPGPHEKGLPGRLFWWEGTDGSRVLTFRIPYEYCTWGKDLEKHIRKVAGDIREPFNELMCFYGVGNHGGGPTKENLASIHRLQGVSDVPDLELSTPNRFFDAVRAENLPVPVVNDELQHHASGCYAAHSGVKRWNRVAENLLTTAERWSSIAEVIAGLPYPAADLERAWKSVLFNQFHDILAGTSLESAYDDARNEYGEAIAVATRALNDAVQSVSWRVNVPFEEGVKPIVVFNPHAWASVQNVELESGGVKDTDVLVDDSGRQVPYQVVRSEATVSGWRKRLSFNADLPALGYRVYRVVNGPEREAFTDVDASDTHLENAWFRVEVDPASAQLRRVLDKRHDVEVLRAPARAVVMNDPSDTWSHGVLHFDDELGEFQGVSVALVERGPVKAVIRARAEYERSTLTQDFTLYSSIDRIDVRVTVDWHGKHQAVKLRYPLSAHFPRLSAEAPYGVLERPADGEEYPMHAWIDATGVNRPSGGMHGVSFLNDGKYAYSVREVSMGFDDVDFTVLRSPIYAHHDPYVPTPGGDYRYIDQGEQRFTYALYPHANGWETAGTARHAAELNARPLAILETFHDGPLAQNDSFASCDRDNVHVTVVKRAEDGDAIVVRAFETTRNATRATIRVPRLEREITADFGPNELKTFLVPLDRAKPVEETDLIEWTR